MGKIILVMKTSIPLAASVNYLLHRLWWLRHLLRCGWCREWEWWGIIWSLNFKGCVGYQIAVMENYGGRNLASLGAFAIKSRWFSKIFVFGDFSFWFEYANWGNRRILFLLLLSTHHSFIGPFPCQRDCKPHTCILK